MLQGNSAYSFLFWLHGVPGLEPERAGDALQVHPHAEGVADWLEAGAHVVEAGGVSAGVY